MKTETIDFEGLRRHEKAYDIMKSIAKIDTDIVQKYIKDSGSFIYMYAYPGGSYQSPSPIKRIRIKMESMSEYETILEYWKNFNHVTRKTGNL